MISLENPCLFKHTAGKLELPAVSKSWVNSGFVAGQQLSGSLVPERASIVTPHCTKRWQSWRRSRQCSNNIPSIVSYIDHRLGNTKLIMVLSPPRLGLYRRLRVSRSRLILGEH